MIHGRYTGKIGTQVTVSWWFFNSLEITSTQATYLIADDRSHFHEQRFHLRICRILHANETRGSRTCSRISLAFRENQNEIRTRLDTVETFTNKIYLSL